MPQSVAFHHFPQIVWRNGKKRLWNSIHRKALKNRPEERVRLRIIEYLLNGGWSKHRISTEEAIDLPQHEAKHRTDLICYSDDFSPRLLIECKAENISLSDQTAQQIARYNQQVNASFLMLTNGRTDHWYRIKNAVKVEQINEIPDPFPERSSPEKTLKYWQNRGFAGKKANPTLRKWLNKALDDTLNLSSDNHSIRYLSFKSGPGDIDLANYYRIFSFEEARLALTFTATEFGGTRLIGIINRNGHNEAVLELNLDLLFDDRAPNASIYWSGDTQNIDIRNHAENFEESTQNINKIAADFRDLLMEIIA